MYEDLASHVEQGDGESHALAHYQHYQEQNDLSGGRKKRVTSLRDSNSAFPVRSERNFQLCLSPLITSQNVLSGWGSGSVAER